ncbi:MAG TPA: BrxA/BrxB family bacilliredoxin [Acidobacteriota bacterium]
MPYDETLVAPMRRELTSLGVKELKTAAEVDQQLASTPGTTMVVVNSVCGCAAGKARPGVSLALKHPVLPDSTVTVFAGQDLEATAKARSYFSGMPPSSPQIALLKDGELVFMMHRHDIEGREAKQIADVLTAAFDQHCS